jgi:tRNA pseudouridine38-40 synthase
VCEYDGTGFCGWQSQPNGPTIQDSIEARLGWIFGREVRIHGSGRTDAGVHATGQVFHFDGEWNHGADKLLRAFRSNLPAAIRVKEVEEVDGDFHARFSAKKKCYKYHLLEDFPGAFNHRYNWCFGNRTLDLEAMQSAALHFHGRHDFSAFGANRMDGSYQNPIKTMHGMGFEKFGSSIIFTAVSDGFLYKMMRLLVGGFAMLGLGKICGSTLLDMLSSGERRIAIEAAPARGLFLHSVAY